MLVSTLFSKNFSNLGSNFKFWTLFLTLFAERVNRPKGPLRHITALQQGWGESRDTSNVQNHSKRNVVESVYYLIKKKGVFSPFWPSGHDGEIDHIQFVNPRWNGHVGPRLVAGGSDPKVSKQPKRLFWDFWTVPSSDQSGHHDTISYGLHDTIRPFWPGGYPLPKSAQKGSKTAFFWTPLFDHFWHYVRGLPPTPTKRIKVDRSGQTGQTDKKGPKNVFFGFCENTFLAVCPFWRKNTIFCHIRPILHISTYVKRINAGPKYLKITQFWVIFRCFGVILDPLISRYISATLQY